MNHALGEMIAGRAGQLCDVVSYDGDGLRLPNGLYIKYAALRSGADGYEYISDARTFRKLAQKRIMSGEEVKVDWTKIYGGKVTENIVQALARIVISEQMASVGKHYPVAFQVHDEIIINVPGEESSDAQELVLKKMSTPPSWAKDLPVACELGVGTNYGEAK